MGRRFEDDIGRELHRGRPSPSDEYVASVAHAIGGQERASSVRSRLAVAIVLSVLALSALATTGGIAQAMTAPQSVAKIVKKVVASDSQVKVKKVKKSAASDQYGEKPKCNSGRGNNSEGANGQLIDPHNGGSGPGESPTLDCDPGNSGSNNNGGD